MHAFEWSSIHFLNNSDLKADAVYFNALFGNQKINLKEKPQRKFSDRNPAE